MTQHWKEAKLKDKADQPHIRTYRNNSITVKDNLDGKVLYADKDILDKCSWPRGGNIANRRYRYTIQDD